MICAFTSRDLKLPSNRVRVDPWQQVSKKEHPFPQITMSERGGQTHIPSFDFPCSFMTEEWGREDGAPAWCCGCTGPSSCPFCHALGLQCESPAWTLPPAPGHCAGQQHSRLVATRGSEDSPHAALQHAKVPRNPFTLSLLQP